MWEILIILLVALLLILLGLELIHRYIVYCIKDYNAYAKHPKNQQQKSSSVGFWTTPGVWDDRNLPWTRLKRWLIKHLSWKSKKL